MADKRDYYEVLGIQKGASADEIKGAYRKAALKWHPDRWVSGTDEEKKAAEEKFKEATEAYSVLSDPDKKARYDQFGFAGVDGAAGAGSGGFSGFEGMGLDDLLNNLFGGAFSGFEGFSGRRSSGPRTIKGSDIAVKLELSLEEIASGCDKEIVVERKRPCPECGGKGTKNSSDIKTCPTCNGSGQVRQSGGFGIFQQFTINTCPNCNGTGKVVSNPCRNCRGTGLVKQRDTLKVHIPAGVEHGMQIPVRGEGDSGANGGTNGDLYVVIQEKPHARLKRSGQDLFYTRIINVLDAILGCEIKVPTLEGEENLKLSAGTQSGTIKKLRGKGLPAVNNYGFGSNRGDLYVKILVWIPPKLDRDERKALEGMKNSTSFKIDPSREDKELFARESKVF